MSYSQSLSNCHDNNHVADDSSTVFDADTVVPDEVPSFPQPELTPLTATATATAIATATDYHHHHFNNNNNNNNDNEVISIRRINSYHFILPRPSTITTATPTTTPTTTLTITPSEEEISISHPNEVNYWKSKFQELCVFKQSYGHTSVPSSFDKELNYWVTYQRTEYTKMKCNIKKTYITNERIEMLDLIGFEWERSTWNERFTELSQYKETHGHTNVSSRSKDYKKLGSWVSKQRYFYKRLKLNKKSQITSKRIEMLDSVGFVWVWRPSWRESE